MRAIILYSSALFFAVFWAGAGPIAAQEAPLPREKRAEIARDNIEALKGGALIVRLPFYQTKVDGLKDILSSGSPDMPNRQRIEKQLETTLADRDTFNQNMITAFREVYDFSEVYFMPDTATASLKSGTRRGIFLDEDREIDPAIQLQGPTPYFILRFGSTSDMTTDGVEAMVVMNDRFKDLDKPFPYYQRLHDFAALMGSIFPAPGQKKKDALRIVGKLNDKLKEYYRQVRL